MMISRATGPFIFLDDARVDGASLARFYSSPLRVIEAMRHADVATALDEVKDAARRGGLHAAGFLSYEAGHALEPRLTHRARTPDLPLLWFGLFDRYQTVTPAEVSKLLPDAAGAFAAAPRPLRSRSDYDTAFDRVQSLIYDGDIYQANLTLPFAIDFAGDPLALYAGLRGRARAGYGGVIWTGRDWLLSLSPELFFAARRGKITTKPMKGTAARGSDDATVAEVLRTDPKQRAENLMIVDLLRNDLSRIAVAGSVETPHLFHVETYPTVHQMTSTVTATMRDGVDAVDVLKAIFPCGSITGAPKIRAMEVIGEVETEARGAYTGSIGRIDANGDAAFNVAIRTLHIASGASTATLGLGGGIVADSSCAAEWEEVQTKGAFVVDRRTLDLIETMRFDPAGGIALLDRHIDRLGDSARALGFAFDRHGVRNELQAATFRIARPRKVRLMLSKSGRIAIEISVLPATPDTPVEVATARLSVARADFRLHHKTSDRSFYSAARGKHFEVALIDGEGFLTEGSFTNLFVKRSGKLLTPPLSRGLLPGVLRAELIDRDIAVEADLRLQDLADGFFIGNACRGLLAARIKVER